MALDDFRKAIVSAIVIFLIALCTTAFVLEIRSDGFVVENFALPKSLAERGYSGDVAAKRLWSHLNNIVQEERSYKNPYRFYHSSERVDISMPDLNVSLQTAARFIRRFFKFPDRRITGEIVCNTGNCNEGDLTLRVRIIDEKIHYLDFKIENTDSAAADQRIGSNEVSIQGVFERAAIGVMEIIDPYRAALYQKERRPREARRIAYKMTLHGNRDQHWGFLFLGDFERAINQDYGSAIAFYNRAIAVDPKFGIAHVNLAFAHIGRNQLAEAQKAIRQAKDLMPRAASPYRAEAAMLRKSSAAPGEVEQTLRNALSLQPDDAAVRVALARHIFEENKNNHEKRVKEMREAFMVISSVYSAEKPLASHVFDLCEIGLKADLGINHDVCVEQFDALIKKWPRDATYRYQKARYLGSVKNDWQAAFDEAMFVSSMSLARLYLLAYIARNIHNLEDRKRAQLLTTMCEALELLDRRLDKASPPSWVQIEYSDFPRRKLKREYCDAKSDRRPI